MESVIQLNKKQPVTACQLGITGMPEDINQLLPGEIYTVITDSVPMRFTFIVQTLLANLNSGRTCCYISNMEGDMLVTRANAAGFQLVPFIEKGQLIILTLNDDHVKLLYLNGAQQLISELEYFQIPDDSHVVLDSTIELLSINDLTFTNHQLAVYQSWIKKKSITVMLCLGLSALTRYPKTREAIFQHFGGLLRLTAHQSGNLEASFDYWYTDDLSVLPRRFLLKIHNNLLEYQQALSSHPEHQASASATRQQITQAALTTPLDHCYYIGAGYQQWNDTYPGHWQWIKNISTFISQFSELPPNLIIFSYSKGIDISEIIAAVTMLRQKLYSNCKVLVREYDYSLRYYDEIFLYRHGINLILYRNTAMFRTQLAIDNLKNITFHFINPNHDQVTKPHLKLNKNPYLSQNGFKKYVISQANLLTQLKVPFVLTTLRSKRLLASLNLRHHIRKTDAMMTLDKDNYWLFLSNCDLTSAQFVLRRFPTLLNNQDNPHTVQSLTEITNLLISKDNHKNALQETDQASHK